MTKDRVLFSLIFLQIILSALPMVFDQVSGPMYALFEILWTNPSDIMLVLNATYAFLLLIYIFTITQRYYMVAIIASVIHILLLMPLWAALEMSIEDVNSMATFTPVYPLMMGNAVVIFGITVYRKFRKDTAA